MARPITLRELLTKTFPPEDFLVGNGLLSKNSILVLGGPPKSYKSFTLASIIYHLTTGTSLFNAHITSSKVTTMTFPVARPLRVLLLEQEIGEADLRQRYQEIYKHIPPAEQELFSENLAIKSLDHKMQLDTGDGLRYIKELIQSFKPDIVAFDPLIEFHTSNENNTQEMARILRNLDAIRESFNVAIIVCHHTAKPNAEAMRSGPDLLRGNSVVFGKGDSFIMISPLSRQDGFLKASYVLRRGKPIRPMVLKLDWLDLRTKFHEWHKSTSRYQTQDDEPEFVM